MKRKKDHESVQSLLGNLHLKFVFHQTWKFIDKPD